MESLSIAVVMACARRLAVSSLCGIGGGLAPSRWIWRPQKGWSAMNGTITGGTPALSEAAVVPIPPWCTVTAMRGKSQSNGADSIGYTQAGRSSTDSPPHPAEITPRCPQRCSASSCDARQFASLAADHAAKANIHRW
jgi:hypothetical protein